MSKKQNLHTQFFTKNKPVKSTDHEAATSINQNSDEGSGSKAEKRKFHDIWKFGLWSFCGSLMIPVTTLCIVIFAERQAEILLAKPNLLPERKSLNVKVLFIIIKVLNIQMFKYGISKCPFLN